MRFPDSLADGGLTDHWLADDGRALYTVQLSLPGQVQIPLPGWLNARAVLRGHLAVWLAVQARLKALAVAARD